MSIKKILAALLIIVVAVGGFVTGLYLLRDKQDISEQAAVPDGDATVKFKPETGNYKIGDTIAAGVYFNTAGIPISGIAVKMTYPFTATVPEVVVSSITVNSNLLSTGQWTCPVQNHEVEGKTVVITIACALQASSTGYTTNVDTLLANVSLKVNSAPSVSPLVVRFDSVESVITRRSDNQDILLIPSSEGTYYIEGVATPTTTATATSKLTSTVSPTKAATTTGTITPTKKLTGTITPTKATLPDAGIGMPTIFGVGLGTLVVTAALLLAL